METCRNSRLIFPRILRAATAIALFSILLRFPAQASDIKWLEYPDQYRWAQNYMLELINEERARAGLNSLRLDSLASQAAKQHADEMLAGSFLSHWDLAGRKPTRRYNLLGGFDSVSENIFSRRGELPDWRELVELQMDVLMDSEGHRAAILDPAKTHVGLGFAADNTAFYSSQEFISRWGGDYRCPLAARVGETVRFTGRFDPARYRFAQLLVSFEDPEQPRTRKWLENTGSYKDGEKLVAGYTVDPAIQFKGVDTFHTVQVDPAAGTFAIDVVLDFKGKPGMYYLLLWLDNYRTGQSANAASVAINVSR